MTTTLDTRIRAALAGRRRGGGVLDFMNAPSGMAKARQVLDIARRERLPLAQCAFISVGGADGIELEHLLTDSEAKCGVLLEFDDELAVAAMERARRLRDDGHKDIQIFTGDAVHKVDAALRVIDSWRDSGAIAAIVVSFHAVLHEFPSRGAGTTDFEAFLQKFMWHGLPLLAIAREPCMPDDLPATVYLSANCRPDVLAELARAIRTSHPAMQQYPEPVPMADRVRMDPVLAIETVTKLFYLESLHYELGERVTSVTRRQLVDAFRNVFGTHNVRTETLQTDSMDRLWKELRIVVRDDLHRELPKPELHVRLSAKWFPPGALAFPASSSLHPSLSTTPPASTSSTGPELLMPRLPDRLVPPLDLWTPGHTELQTLTCYEPIVGGGIAQQLWSISQDGVAAVSEGDFQQLVDIGNEVIQLVPDNGYLQAEGSYFTGEGERLLATLPEHRARMGDLHARALEAYQRSSALVPYDPRPIRGIGRLLQLQGRFDEALRYFVSAKGLCLAGLASGGPTLRRDLAHEALRTTRHMIHCILDVRTGNKMSRWNRESKRPELEGLLVECDNLHREYMPLFVELQAWSMIEWFMALVFIGAAWAKLGNPERGRLCLAYSLRARDSMIAECGDINAIERANLRWWLTAASDRAFCFDMKFVNSTNALTSAIDKGDRRRVHDAIDDSLSLLLPPWHEAMLASQRRLVSSRHD